MSIPKHLVAPAAMGIAIALFCGCNIQVGEPAYHLAQQCLAIETSVDGQVLQPLDQNQMELIAGDSIATKHGFFMKPTGLGSFLIYDEDGGFLGRKNETVIRQWSPDQHSEWQIKNIDFETYSPLLSDHFVITNLKGSKYLAIEDGNLKLRRIGADPDFAKLAFHFIPLSSCKDYPEASLDAAVAEEFFEPRSNSPVWGFVDYHTHIGFPRALGGVAMSGHTFHRYGIEFALHDCERLHGENGNLDWLEAQNTGGGQEGHQTAGYPDFTYWPNRQTNTHIQAYYRWMERAYLSGMRMVITNTTGNPTFCQLLGVLHPKEKAGDCRSDDDTAMQVNYIYDMQNYIDAQAGGPGKGWFRVVTSPAQARKVIGNNQLAVILGSEYGTLFDCTEGSKSCDRDYIIRKVDELYDLGIRSVFPIHRFDNAFGGTRPQGGSGGAWMHLTSKISTSRIQHLLDLLNPAKLLFRAIKGHYWNLALCDEGIQGVRGIKSMAEFIEKDFAFLQETVKKVPVVGGLAANIINWTFIDKLKPLPEYQEFANGQPACNVRSLQPAGERLLERLMARGMIIEIDHMSYPTLLKTLDILEDHQYPAVVSSHNWIENSNAIRERIIALGGQIAAGNGNPRKIGDRIQQYGKMMKTHDQISGVGIGTDIQGVTSQAWGEKDVPITYPFQSVDGQVTFYPPKTGNRSFSFAKEGVAHYGLLAEWIQTLQLIDEKDGTRHVESLMSSAEAYIQMWEKAEERRFY